MGVLEEALKKIGSKTQLIEMDQDGGGCDAPCKMNSEKPFNNACEIYLALLSQESAEESFSGRVFKEKEVNKVTNVEAKGEG